MVVFFQVYMTHEELNDDELLQHGDLEFHQINYDQSNGRPYCYFYSCGFGHVFGDSLLKMDVHTKEVKIEYSTFGLDIHEQSKL
ncbi:Beta,beta-carotene 9',10'-oxygenase [Channa argus]|uniref:Beta,beta-carotene 9',10'-oxygenase n=1 Tax=Channa argus TaxID=215402 RepID=A0A6G1QJ49_CHAAH|nr:Beta,beta-carotene 9',10'-oxygenase [Channa argus]